MPVDVNIPLGIRVSSPIAPDELALLELRTGDIMRNALETARDEVLVPRGRRRPVVVHRDYARFAGEVPPEQIRIAIEEAVQRGIDHAVSASQVDSWYEPGTVAAASGGRVGEPMDLSRLFGRVYGIPSYNGNGAPVGVDADGDFTVVDILTVEAVLELAWEAHRNRFGPVWDPTSYGHPGYYGTFSIDGELVENQLVYFASVEAIDEHGNPTNFRWQGGSFYMVDPPPEEEVEVEGALIHSSLSPAMDHYVLTRTDHGGSEQNLLRLMDEAARHDEHYPYDQATRERLAREVSRPDWPVFRLEGGRHLGYLVLPPGSTTTGVGHSPIRFIAPDRMHIGTDEGAGQGAGGEGAGGGSSEGGTGGGGTGTGGRRGRGGPLGTGEGHGTLWPQLSGDGDPIVCEPYLGEPPVTQLATGGEELDRRMRELANLLEVPYCGYAGHFALNLADVIGGHAHAVGVASANSTTRTRVAVRADGDGNNGFVDVQPSASAELDYLTTLGDLAVQVSQLSNLIVNTYLLQANRHLIYWDEDHDLDPNAAAWSLRFSGAFADKLENSCKWLYAECCRVILLQQLRSSNDGITQRRASFDTTLRQFEESLSILGQSVLKFSILKRAVEYGRRHRHTGSVRSVLSQLPPPMRMGRGEGEYQPPAPIDSIAPDLITALEGATIADESGTYVAYLNSRRLTVEELDMGIAMRRGMLNRVDPLFLQVPNLESVYTRYRSDPNSTRTYLDELLSEMLRANVEMTAETSARDDGAFFALEASQYVKARGGMNERGLKYDLQGIHALADDVLRPYAQGTDAYRRGINAAIGIKAGWDDFVSTFATFGIIVLGLLCAPLGAGVALFVTAVAGLALTAWDIHEADRMEDLYHSLLDPEAILSWQDVEMQRLMANLSIVFSIFDVIGVAKGAAAIVRGFGTGIRTLARQGVRGALVSAVRAGRRQLAANMAREVLENAIKQAVGTAAVMAAMNELLPRLITPILVPWLRGVAVEHGTLPEVDAALGPLAAGQPLAPVPIAMDEPAIFTEDPPEPAALADEVAPIDLEPDVVAP